MLLTLSYRLLLFTSGPGSKDSDVVLCRYHTTPSQKKWCLSVSKPDPFSYVLSKQTYFYLPDQILTLMKRKKIGPMVSRQRRDFSLFVFLL